MDAARPLVQECHGLTENSYVNPERKNCRDGVNFSERLTTSRNQEQATSYAYV